MKCFFGIALFVIVLLVQAHTLNIQSSQEIEIKSKTLCPQNNSKVIEPEIKPENLASFDCEEGDVYCLCKYHPKYRDCVCMAFPRSVVCSSTFCYENKNSYECNPNYCDTDEGKGSPNCFCKNNANHLSCKCKTNPFHKDCFCMKFPLSHLCNERLCRYNPNTLYCRCLINPADPMCGPGFCHENADSPQCECLNKPLSENCRCINEPGSCTQEQIMDSIVNFDKRIRSGCSGNSTSADKQTLFNQYYPPCIYDKGSDSKSQPKNIPCLPYPGAPQPCDKNSKTPCLSKVKDKPCVKTNFKSKKQKEEKRVNLAYSVVNAPINGRK